MVKKIYKAILIDHQLKVRELADLVSILKIAVHRILTENSDMTKLRARWVLRCSRSNKNNVVKMFQLRV